MACGKQANGLVKSTESNHRIHVIFYFWPVYRNPKKGTRFDNFTPKNKKNEQKGSFSSSNEENSDDIKDDNKKRDDRDKFFMSSNRFNHDPKLMTKQLSLDFFNGNILILSLTASSGIIK